jgi:hypothetical protein
MRPALLIILVFLGHQCLLAQCGVSGRWIINPLNGELYCIPQSGSIQPPVPGYPANQILEGCGVEYTGTGLNFTVGQCTYTINGATYTSPLTNITLDASDPGLNRIDMIAVDITSSAIKVTGVAAADPSKPTVDPSTQLELTFITILAGATTPSGITTDLIYDENVEWTVAVTANIVEGANSNAYKGARSVEATNAVLGNNAQFTKPAGSLDVLTRDYLLLYLCSKVAWPSTRQLGVWFQNNTNQRGQQVIVRDGTFGFESSVAGSCGVGGSSWQQIAIPTALFQTNGQAVNRLRIQVVGAAGSGTIGWYLDNVKLQLGLPPIPILPEERTFGITVDGGGAAISTGVKGYAQIPYGCTITGWTLLADQSGSLTFDLWKDVYDNYPPTVADTITAAAKPLISAAAKNTSTSVSTWAKTITAGDVIGFNVDSAATVQRVHLLLKCTKI